MKASLQKWGNSLAVRVPKSIAQDAHLTTGSEVDLRLEGDRIVLIPVPRKRYTLKSLVAGITPANLPAGDPFGPPMGKEVW